VVSEVCAAMLFRAVAARKIITNKSAHYYYFFSFVLFLIMWYKYFWDKANKHSRLRAERFESKECPQKIQDTLKPVAWHYRWHGRRRTNGRRRGRCWRGRWRNVAVVGLKSNVSTNRSRRIHVVGRSIIREESDRSSEGVRYATTVLRRLWSQASARSALPTDA